MPRPKRFRRILEEPQIRCFRPEKDNVNSSKPIEVTIDEFEAIRLRDYHDIQQKRSAAIMGISQPTFHRILTSVRKKISKALIEGNSIIIIGDDYITNKKRYKCNICGFEWLSPEKEYQKCPDCQSEDLNIVIENEKIIKKTEPSLLQRKILWWPGFGGRPTKSLQMPKLRT